MRNGIITSVLTTALLSLSAGFASASHSFVDQFRFSTTPHGDRHNSIAPSFVSGHANGVTTCDCENSPAPAPCMFSENETAHWITPVFQETSCPSGELASEHFSDDGCHQCWDESIDDEVPLLPFRDGCFQGVQVNHASIQDDAYTGIAIRTIDAAGTFVVPLGSMDNLISFTPYFRADLLEAAAIFDVPEALYDTGVKMFWRRPISDHMKSTLLITPSIRSDFRTSDDAFRLFGLALLSWQYIPETLTFSGGVLYTGRADFPVLPAGGVQWMPTPRWKYDIQFPAPRISYRLAKNGGCHETWAFLGGVFGGNTWSVKRAGGDTDELTLSDLRLVLGIEHLQPKNRSVFVEAGYVFNRSIEYTNVGSEQDLDAALMLRTGLTF